MDLNLDQARQIIAGAQAAGLRQKYKPLTIVVLDAGGHLIAAEREDGSSYGRFDIASGKAAGSLAVGMGSRALMARAEQQAYFVNAAGAVLGGSLVPVPGGVLVQDADGVLLGAVGISGDISDHDEAAAIAGIESIGLVAQPD